MSGTDKGRNGPLTREAILAAALRLVDETGLGAISMRKLATALGAGTMSLYNHVPNKQALLQGISEVVLAEVESGRRGDEPIDVLLVTAGSLRRALLAHPNAAPLVVQSAATSPESFHSLEATLSAFRGFGLGPQGVSYAQRALVGFVVGHVLFELHPIGSDQDLDRSFEFGLEALLEGLLEHEGDESG
jgi:AcrR family transcriptional regulator